jgi:hypothetical protein
LDYLDRFYKIPTVKFHGNLSTRILVVAWEQTDMTKSIDAFRNYVNGHSLTQRLKNTKLIVTVVSEVKHEPRKGDALYINRKCAQFTFIYLYIVGDTMRTALFWDFTQVLVA